MTSLTRIGIKTRRIIRYSVYIFIGIIIARMLILGGIRVYRYFFPAPPAPPTVEFGRLPVLPFPKSKIPEGLTYKLETPEGSLPVFPDQLKVYFMPKLSTHLLSLEAAKIKASNLGFSPEGVDITETVYKFSHEKAPAELQISITTGVFAISYNLVKDPEPLDYRPIPAEVATSKIRSFLSSGDVLPEDLTGPTIPEFVKLQNKKIVRAISASNANFTKVHFLRKDFDDLPSLSPKPNEGNVWFIVSGHGQKEKQIIAGEFHHFPVDETVFATYPIKTSQSVWEEFTNGNYYLANLGTNNSQNPIVIRRIYLAYYDPGVAANFYQPIVVLEGDKDFVAYLPAVTYDYYGE